MFGFADFVADDAADNGAADGSERAAVRKHGAADGADPSADGGVPILRRHAGTTHQAEQQRRGNCTEL
jgi:hypothetical protein